MNRQRYRPGQRVPASGDYRACGPRGGWTAEVKTLRAGDPFPPTIAPGMGWIRLGGE